MPETELNRAWHQRACCCLAGGVSSHFRTADPVVFSHGRGSHIWDVDGNEYIDYTLSQGPLIHGHSHRRILGAVSAALADGQIWNGLHGQEIELAELLVRVIPCADSVRLGCTGSEAVHAALRLAKAFTGKSKIIKFEGHYHGWLDNVAASINPTLEQAGTEGQPSIVPWTEGLTPGSLDQIVVLPWNRLNAVQETLDRYPGQIAAILTEPCMCNAGCIEPEPGYLEGLRKICDRNQVVLVFDEVITGFRLALGGAGRHYGVTPDLAVFAKAVAAGFPLSVLAGQEAIMQLLADGRVIHAGTLNAQTAAVAAAKASIELLAAENGSSYRRLYQYAERLNAGLTDLAAEAGQPVRITGPGPVFHMGFLSPSSGGDSPVRNYRDVVRAYDSAKYSRFVRLMAERGVRLIGRGIWYVSTVHSAADLEKTLGAARDAMQVLR